MKAKKKKYVLEELKKAPANGFSVAGVLKILGLIVTGGNYSKVKRKIVENRLDTSHSTGKSWRKVRKYLGRKFH